jgi:hypothetical protein
MLCSRHHIKLRHRLAALRGSLSCILTLPAILSQLAAEPLDEEGTGIRDRVPGGSSPACSASTPRLGSYSARVLRFRYYFLAHKLAATFSPKVSSPADLETPRRDSNLKILKLGVASGLSSTDNHHSLLHPRPLLHQHKHLEPKVHRSDPAVTSRLATSRLWVRIIGRSVERRSALILVREHGSQKGKSALCYHQKARCDSRNQCLKPRRHPRSPTAALSFS